MPLMIHTHTYNGRIRINFSNNGAMIGSTSQSQTDVSFDDSSSSSSSSTGSTGSTGSGGSSTGNSGSDSGGGSRS